MRGHYISRKISGKCWVLKMEPTRTPPLPFVEKIIIIGEVVIEFCAFV